jgi:DNA-binding NtrC family response regulator
MAEEKPATTVATLYSESMPGASTAPRCQLVVIEGPDQGRAVPISAREIVVGTAPDCDLALTDDRVSKRHLGIAAQGGRFVARDLDSKNGTLYEGSLLRSAEVSAGATLKVGRTFLRIQPRPEALEIAPSQSRRFGDLVAVSLAMREVFAVLERAAPAGVTVLIEGETGTGKELAARALHEASGRRGGPFVALDCGALPESLLESELFGHVKGAFTGAAAARAGAFARAHRGTLFLDELGSVPPTVQARLLRAIEERKVRPVGADSEREVDVRLIAASRHDLGARVAEGAFRPDLFYRLSVVSVVLPPLRQRREDIPLIATELLRRRGVEPGKISGPNLDRLLAQPWPGNVRELRNVIDRAVAMSPEARSFAELKLSVAPGAAAEPLSVRGDLPFAEAKQLLVEAFEQRYLRDVLERAGGNISAAARASGLDRKHLKTLLRRHGLLKGEAE